MPTFITQNQAADLAQVTPRTIRNWITAGYLTGYRTPSGRAIRVNRDELVRVLSSGLIPSVRPFGARAKIVDLTRAVQPVGGFDGDDQ